MVSDFITENDGFMCLIEDEFQAAKRNNPNIKMSARKFLEKTKCCCEGKTKHDCS